MIFFVSGVHMNNHQTCKNRVMSKRITKYNQNSQNTSHPEQVKGSSTHSFKTDDIQKRNHFLVIFLALVSNFTLQNTVLGCFH